MRILHVAASYLPATRYGGTIVSVHALCRALARRGHDVHVFTTSVDGPGDSPVSHDVPVDVEGVQVWYFRSRHLRRFYWAPSLARELRRRARTFDVIHTHAIYVWPLWAGARQARRDGVPYVLSLRGMLEKDLIDQKSPLAKAVLIAFIERANIERAAAIHVTSRREAEQARAFGFNFPPFHEIPNGVDAEARGDVAASAAIAATIDAGPFTLFLGRINWKKGLDRLLAALTIAPEIRLVIAGNDEEGYQARLEALARRLQLGDRVSFVGPVSGVDKAALLRNAQMLVLPSYSENFGNVVVEAMAAGRPVIVTPEVGVADLVRDGDAGVVCDGAPKPFGEAMAALAADAGRCRALGMNGRALVAATLTWDAVAGRMEELYAGVTGRAC